ncbi:hypothetical protein LZ578_02085 [Jeotgalibaca sp. MA1X17-3]|uniref:hypothetical protein n=1 Tax=Jeotgalibaca sp. MA1X17-3 TaxID=2908211 RepID=UPI001F23593C|nr:hypothetical protein [Jeotgalibaca sp. MA1X17-3]UJF15957.1 hypothetical protein LZ578_02085 [Jeotgalibaca sp. MA1X17-3]
MIKDFKQISLQAEAREYKKYQFIFQKSVALYREDFLLTMMLEPLSQDMTPQTLVNRYNQHLDYYNQLLVKDKEKGLPANVTGYSEKASTNFRKNIAPHAKLFPDTFYATHTFPTFITSITDNDKFKIIEILIDLYNLDFDKEALKTSIKDDPDRMLIDYLKRQYQEADPLNNNHTWNQPINMPSTFKALQMYWSEHKNLHLVFNKRTIDILTEYQIPHPFIYINTNP